MFAMASSTKNTPQNFPLGNRRRGNGALDYTLIEMNLYEISCLACGSFLKKSLGFVVVHEIPSKYLTFKKKKKKITTKDENVATFEARLVSESFWNKT